MLRCHACGERAPANTIGWLSEPEDPVRHTSPRDLCPRHCPQVTPLAEAVAAKPLGKPLATLGDVLAAKQAKR